MKCILRTTKLKTLGNIAGSAAHVSRNRNTPNANSDIENIDLLGSGDIFNDVKNMIPKKHRSNAVLCVETLLTASPEFFQKKSELEIMVWANDSIKSMKKFWSEKNVVSATLHLDEATPHIHLYAVPVIDEKLNCREFLGGAAKLSKLQDHYAQDMKKFNLERGIKGSKQKHITQKKLSAHVDNVPVPKLVKIEAVTKEKKILGQRVIVDSVKDTVVSERTARRLHTIAQGRFLDKQRADTLESTLRCVSVDSLRSISLLEVVQKLNYKQSPDDKNQFITPTGKISITGEKFFNFSTGEGGGGAIDLVMNAEEVDFKNACSILGGYCGVDRTVDTNAVEVSKYVKKLAQSRTVLIQPKLSEKHTPDLKNWLINTRKIPEKIVSNWIEKGHVYASKFSKNGWQAIFTNPNGFFRKNTDTGYAGWIKGSHPEPHFYQTNQQHIAICESHIDAMSFQATHEKISCCMVNGIGGADTAIAAILAMKKTPILALDNDEKGNEITRKLVEKYKKIGVDVAVLQSTNKDWNEDLLLNQQQESFDFNKNKINNDVLVQNEIKNEINFDFK